MNKREIRNCLYCGRPLEKTQSKYCSHECFARSNTGANNSGYAGGDIYRKCLVCGKVFSAQRGAISRGQGRYCSQRCWAVAIAKVMRERAHPNSHGGKRDDLGGLYVRSSWEANYARYLNFLVSNGEILGWEYEPDTFEFPVKRGNIAYTPDFKIINNDGSVEYHEVKGYMDKDSAVKLKRMEKYYPTIKVVVIGKDEYTMLKKWAKLINGWE